MKTLTILAATMLAFLLTGCGDTVPAAKPTPSTTQTSASPTPEPSPEPPPPTVTVTAEPAPTVTVTPDPTPEPDPDVALDPAATLMDQSQFWEVMGIEAADEMGRSICDGLETGLTPQDIFEAGVGSGMAAEPIGQIMAYAAYAHCPDYVEAMSEWADDVS